MEYVYGAKWLRDLRLLTEKNEIQQRSLLFLHTLLRIRFTERCMPGTQTNNSTETVWRSVVWT